MYAAGYLGPSVAGMLAALLLWNRHAVAVLWSVLVLLTLLLLQIRNWFGLLVVLMTGLGVFAASWWLSEQGQSAVAYLLTSFLLIAAPRPVLELARQRRRRGAGRSDADELARLTRIPAVVWLAVFLVATMGSAVAGSWLVAAGYR